MSDLTDEPDIVGETIPGPEGTPRFQVEYRIGEGGQAWVYKALDQKLGRYVAIKVLRPDGDDGYSEGYESRFTNEARMTAALACNYTMTVHDYGTSAIDGFEYIVMVSEFINGIDLHTYITRHGALTRMECLLVLSQIAESLAEAHARGFIHRDLKSPNIMVEHDDGLLRGIKVLDFGIGKAITKGSEWDGGHTKVGDFILSPMFSSPEQVLGNELGPPTDLYSLGVIAYHCLVGVHPYHHLAGRQNAMGVVMGHVVSEQLIRLPEMFDGRPLTDIVHKLLEKDLGRRYSDCRELSNDLENLETSSQPLRRLGGLRTPALEELTSEATQKLSELVPTTERLDAGATDRLEDLEPTQVERPHETINSSYSVARSAAQEFGDTRAIRSGVFDPLDDKTTEAFAPPTPETIRGFELEQARKKSVLGDTSRDTVAPAHSSPDVVSEADASVDEPGVAPTQQMSEEVAGSGARRIGLVILAACVLVTGVGLSGVFVSGQARGSQDGLGVTSVQGAVAAPATTPDPAPVGEEAVESAPLMGAEEGPSSEDSSLAPVEHVEKSRMPAEPALVRPKKSKAKSKTKPVLEKPKAIAEAPKTSEKTDVAKKPEPVAEKSEPVAEKAKPVVKEPEPVIKPVEEKSPYFGVD